MYWLQLVNDQFPILETMTPMDFLDFRLDSIKMMFRNYRCHDFIYV